MQALFPIGNVNESDIHICNAPYKFRGADGLPWWSPSQVLTTIYSVCKCVCVYVCVYCFVWYLISRPILVTRLLFLTSYRCGHYRAQLIPEMSHRPFHVPLCRRPYRLGKLISEQTPKQNIKKYTISIIDTDYMFQDMNPS